MTLEELYNKKKTVEGIIVTVRKSAGDNITDMLPKLLRDYGFRVFALTEKTLIIIFGDSEIIDQQIMIEHGFGDDGKFRMSVKNPGFYSKINLLENTNAMIYYKALAEVLSNKVFIESLKERLIGFDIRMGELKRDVEEINTEIKRKKDDQDI